jgi:hypothetical protein
MKEEILRNLGDPRELERLYRENKTAFAHAFNLIFPEVKDDPAARTWHERLNYEEQQISRGLDSELITVVLSCLVAGLIAKMPEIIGVKEDLFYQRNLSIIVLPLLTAYFAWRNRVPAKNIIIASVITLISVMYINLLPDSNNSDTLLLACIHLPFFLWTVLGYVFTGTDTGDLRKRLDFLRYNGDLLVMTAIILIAGAILTGITVGLFALIKIRIEEFYFRYIAVWGLASAPIVGTYLVQTNPQLVSRVSPVIARVFTPLVLVMLLIYLVAVVQTGKDPYNDREFLLVFNSLLIGVMALILFSISEHSDRPVGRTGVLLLSALSLVTILISGIALSAIIFRITQFGITPNRLAVLGGDLLIFINLLLVIFRLLKAVGDPGKAGEAGKAIASFLPIYSLWAAIVTFIFPVLFGFR